MSYPTGRRHFDGEHFDAPAVRVLLVDDDLHFRRWVTLLMQRAGFTVEVAGDGVEALSCLRTATFDLLIADLEMPKMDGLDLIREIRATPQLAHQYAVMLTSHEDLDSKLAALTIGYDDFLAKSCSEAEVVAKVIAAKRMLARNRMLSAAASEWQSIATRDELTGVATRRALVESVERAIAEGRDVGIALLDLDDFKPVNDTFGHLMGDRILRDIGTLFLRRTRANELVARYGGDEFVLMICDLPLEDVAGAANRLMAEIESLHWTSGDATFAIRVSAGVAHSSLIDSVTLERLLDAADRDLYARKWVKKHAGSDPALYEYGRSSPGYVVPHPAGSDPAPLKRAADEET
jgi:two-component system cell cycle response regulator